MNKLQKALALALSPFVMTSLAPAEKFWIPAEKFSDHSSRAIEGELIRDPERNNQQVYLLESGDQVRIQLGVSSNLESFLNQHPLIEVCAYVANENPNDANRIRATHYDPKKNEGHDLQGSNYRLLCSEIASIDSNNILAAGVKVVQPSEGAVKVRGISIRGHSTTMTDPMPAPEEEGSGPISVEDYEYSRAVGYLWGDGNISTDGDYLTFRKANWAIPKHFGSVATAAFGPLDSNNTKYRVQVPGFNPQDFLDIGPDNVRDPRAFLTSVLEGEGAVQVGRLMDDPLFERCAYLKKLVDDLNPQCNANTCVDSRCDVPNCAFIANGSSRGQAYTSNRNCGVYLSGQIADWQEMLDSEDFHFMSCNRVPGGECQTSQPGSRPDYAE